MIFFNKFFVSIKIVCSDDDCFIGDFFWFFFLDMYSYFIDCFVIFFNICYICVDKNWYFLFMDVV